MESQKQPSQGRKVLVLDDDADITTSFKRGLQNHGYDVDAFMDPEVALNNFKPGKYDMLLVDIAMPKMDGFAFFKKIQSLEPKAKVCFVTAYETYFNAYREIFPDLEVGCFVKKPISISDLAEQIELAISHQTKDK
jgi:DNA-binding NtrC family response regulator